MEKLSNLLIRFASFGLIAMTAIIGWQVFGRFVLDSSPSWSDQAALVLMIWYIFFAAAAGVWEQFHIRIEILEHRLAPDNKRRLMMLIHCIVLFFGLILALYGAQLVWLVRDHVIPSLGISRGVAYLPIPISGALMVLFTMARMRLRWKGEA